MIYLDNAATTKIDAEVLACYNDIETRYFANPSARHTAGVSSHQILDQYESAFYKQYRLTNKKVIFTSNATEANNLGIFGILQRHKSGTIITTIGEHASILECLKHAPNFKIIVLGIDQNGQISRDEFCEALSKDVVLVAIQHVNNITGAILDIPMVLEELKSYPRAKLLLDMVQGITKVPLNFDLNQVDMWSFSTHKMFGPKGVGGLVMKNNLPLEPITYGSNAQSGLKPGTQSVGLSVAALKALMKFGNCDDYEHIKSLNHKFREGLKQFPEVIINSPVDASPHILNISIPLYKSEVIQNFFESNGIIISAGAACSSKTPKPNATLMAMFNDEHRAQSSVRFSFAHDITLNDIDYVLDVTKQLIERK